MRNVLSTLDQMFLSKRVSHSLLFSGGRLEDANAFAKKLLGPSHEAKIASGNHPDLHIYQPEEKSGLHSMVNIQKLIREMALPPFESKIKIFIIEHFEKMLPSGSNALLKTLEEPPEDTYFILLSDHPSWIPPTILSRLTPISFGEQEIESLDIDPYLTMAKRGDWDELLDALKNLEEVDPQRFFYAILQSIKDPDKFQNISTLIAEAQQALDHNVKPRTVFLNILVNID